MSKDLYGKLFSVITDFEGAGIEVNDAGLIINSLEMQLEEEIEALTQEPRMVNCFLGRYPMYAALLRAAKAVIDKQASTLQTAVEASMSTLREMKDKGAATQSDQDSRAFHAGYEAGKQAALASENLAHI